MCISGQRTRRGPSQQAWPNTSLVTVEAVKSFRTRKECHLLNNNTKRKTKPQNKPQNKKTLDDSKFGTRVPNIFWLVQIKTPSLWMLKKKKNSRRVKEKSRKRTQIPFCLSGVLRRVFPLARKGCLRRKPGWLSQNTPDLCGRLT